MKKILLVIVCLLTITSTQAQTAEEYYQQGLDAFDAQKIEESIDLFTKSIKLDETNYMVWLRRGMNYGMLGDFDKALPDINQVIKLNSTFPQAYILRGAIREELTLHKEAMEDYNKALQLDSENTIALDARGTLYLKYLKRDSACADFSKALALGKRDVRSKVADCDDTVQRPPHSVMKLTTVAKDTSYGFSKDNPVKVGTGYSGGAANERDYLSLLRDVNGNRIGYSRKGSCCVYKSPYGPFGQGVLDVYEVSYYDKDGKEHFAAVYISVYDYEEPKILNGFKTVGQQ